MSGEIFQTAPTVKSKSMNDAIIVLVDKFQDGFCHYQMTDILAMIDLAEIEIKRLGYNHLASYISIEPSGKQEQMLELANEMQNYLRGNCYLDINQLIFSKKKMTDADVANYISSQLIVSESDNVNTFLVLPYNLKLKANKIDFDNVITFNQSQSFVNKLKKISKGVVANLEFFGDYKIEPYIDAYPSVPKGEDFRKKVYLVRADGVPYNFAMNFVEILKKYVDNDQITYRLFDSRDIAVNMDNSISMDAYIYGEHRVDVSRLFEVSSSQNNPLCMYSKVPIDKQVSMIPKGNYILVDDDSLSGFGRSMAYVKNALNKAGINVMGTYTLVSKLIKEDEMMYDIVDVVDFYAGAENGGLMVDTINGIKRVPYIYPFVNLTKRANIPPSKQMKFSKELASLVLNQDFSNNTDKLLSDLSYYKIIDNLNI